MCLCFLCMVKSLALRMRAFETEFGGEGWSWVDLESVNLYSAVGGFVSVPPGRAYWDCISVVFGIVFEQNGRSLGFGRVRHVIEGLSVGCLLLTLLLLASVAATASRHAFHHAACCMYSLAKQTSSCRPRHTAPYPSRTHIEPLPASVT